MCGGRPARRSPIGAGWPAAVLAGAAWVAVPVVLRLRFGVLEVISTLLLNFVAEALVSLMVQGPLQEHSTSIPRAIRSPRPARLPLLPGTRLHLGFAAALVTAGAPLVRFLAHLWGFRLRAAGLRPARRRR